MVPDDVHSSQNIHSRKEAPPEARILLVTGSPRKNGNSEGIAAHVASTAEKAGVPCFHARLPDYRFDPCSGCELCRKTGTCAGLQDGMQLLYPLVVKSSGLILISPVHNYNVTAWMKAFIDRLYCFYDFMGDRPGPWSSRLAGQGRKAAVVSVGEQHGKEGIGMTLEAMRLPLEALGYEILEELPVTGVFPRGGALKSPEVTGRVTELALKTATAVARGPLAKPDSEV